ncbi:MAG TPA: malate/lactate/ureidoglycolate dehydrogenase [Xanthobacteraceae bacterium]
MKIEADVLQDFVRDIFVGAGCSGEEGTRISKYLVSANLVGHDSHGVVRVPRYVQSKLDGQIHGDRTVEVLIDTPVLAVVDGKAGYGQTVTPQAVAIGIRKAKEMGLAAVALRNAGHIGRVGDWAEMAAEAGLISIHFVNAFGSCLVAPFGGVERRFSTAPYCVGIPRPGQRPVILDFATSVVAEGKVLVASQGGKPLPADALVGPDGEISNDPHQLYGDYEQVGHRDYRKGKGAIRAFGDHKGSGLALICELLGGALSGTGATRDAPHVFNGMFSIYVDPKRLDPDNVFPGEMARYIDWVRQSKPIKEGGEILIPGEPEDRNRAERTKNGIPIPDDLWASIVETARKVGIEPPHNLVGGEYRAR